MIATTYFRDADLARSRPDHHFRWLPPLAGMTTTRREPEGPGASGNWDEMERHYWHTTKIARQRADADLSHEYSSRQESIRTRLVGMYDRKSQLQNELQSIIASIELQENEQERLATEHENNCLGLAARRQQEDRAQQDWFSKARREQQMDRNGIRPNSSSTRPDSRGSSASAVNSPAAWTSINGARSHNSHVHEIEPPTDPGNLLSSVYSNPMNETEANARSMPFRTNKGHGEPPHDLYHMSSEDYSGQGKKLAERPLKPKQRHSLPGFSSIARSAGAGPPTLSEDNTPEVNHRSPSSRKSLPGPKSHHAIKPDIDVDDGYEITKSTSTIQDNGTIITAPAMFVGCPLEKIDEKSEYWDIEWQSLESIIQPQLDKWKEKLASLRQTPDAVRHTVFLANRQVNRGQAVVDFLADKESPFHPYQFVGKEMMAKFYKTFINYDTMFRLVNVHEELKKFDLDVSPLEWLRQRMHELCLAQGDKFSLSKTVHDLYHDAKLKYLREKHGFGNIGRPSGYKLGEKAPERPAAKVKARRDVSAGGGSVRRKARRSIDQVDSEEPGSENAMQNSYHVKLPGPNQIAAEAMGAVDRLPKRARLDGLPLPALPPLEPEEDLDFSGYTSTDSFSGGRIMHLDWRIYQIRTQAMTTSTDVTQYWTWKNDANKFEHQVLRDVQPKVTWGIYQKPLNFNVTLDETAEIQYAPNCQKIMVVTKNEKRGNVLAHFKRERTKKRFLSFAKKKGVKLVISSLTAIEDIWNSMESTTLPSEESAP